MNPMTKLVLLSAGLLAANASVATEGGTSSYPVGAENYTCCALPPPGTYGMVWYQNYSADTVRDNDGNDVSPSSDFQVTANAVVPRIVWVTDKTFQGASVALHYIQPLVDLDVTVMDGVEDATTGLGDGTLGLALGWHHSPSLHTVAALDIIVPTGTYDKDEIANPGRNHFAIQPVYGVSKINPDGLNYDLKGMWTYNLENNATGYQDGQELIFDYALGWGLGNGWTAGVGGYLYKQMTDDCLDGDTVADAKGQALAFGPSVKYDSGKGWFATFKYQMETNVKNRAEGNALWVKTVFPLF